ncbi:MAG: tetratricopeptide repeat protein [Bacteroidota bacterium]|nr:tetratricopeptide repeat protein [Bacteroidota bacterium]
MIRINENSFLLRFVGITCLSLFLFSCASKKNISSNPSKTDSKLSNSSDELFIDAVVQKQIGNNEKAIQLFLKYIAQHPKVAASYFHLSELYAIESKNDLVLQNAMQAYELENNNKFFALNYAKTLAYNRNLDLAINVLQNAIKNHPKDEPLAKELDGLFIQKGQIDEAIKVWQNFEKHAGYKLSTSLRLIELYKVKKDFQSAHDVYDQIKKASPLKIKYYIDDARIYKQQGDDVNAILNLEKAVAIQPSNYEVNLELYQFYNIKKDTTKSNVYFRNIISDAKVGSDKKAPLVKDGMQQFEQNAHQNQLLWIANQMQLIHPNDDRALFMVAQIYDLLKDDNKAIDFYQKATAINPNLFDAWQNAIFSANRSKQYKKAIEISKEALDFFPNQTQFYVLLSKSQLLQKEYQQALTTANNGLKIAALQGMSQAGLIELNYQKIAALIKLQNFLEATKEINEFLKINNDDFQLNEYMGDILALQGKTEEAVSFWKKAINSQVENKILNQKIKEKKYVE